MGIEEPDVLSLEHRFFNGLIANVEAVEHLMSDDSLLIDVLSGSEVTKSELITVLRSGQLKFETIKPLESRVRFYRDTALVTGSTEMRGRFGDDSFSVLSRYTHVYVRSRDRWHLVSAQGTQIKTEE
jgi:ketosteroid isomerase-like protein